MTRSCTANAATATATHNLTHSYSHSTQPTLAPHILDFYAQRSSWLINAMFHIKDDSKQLGLSDLSTFTYKALRRTRLPPQLTILVVALLVRLKSRWPAACSSAPAAGHRLFLAAFMIAYKTSIDDCFSNASMVTLCQGVYKLTQINAMERELLALLDYQTHFNDKELDETQSLFGQPPSQQHSMDVEMSRLSRLSLAAKSAPSSVAPTPIPVQLKSEFSSPSSVSSLSCDEDSFGCQSSPDTMLEYHPYACPEFK